MNRYERKLIPVLVIRKENGKPRLVNGSIAPAIRQRFITMYRKNGPAEFARISASLINIGTANKNAIVEVSHILEELKLEVWGISPISKS